MKYLEMGSGEISQTSLSKRESQVLALAVEGLIDAQIAQQLNISEGTVNSYWVRIRGKLGHFSRTELVARAIRNQTCEQIERLTQRLDDFERQLAERKDNQDDSANARLYLAALEAVPDPLFVIKADGTIIFTNEKLEALFSYRRGELIGEHISVLIPAHRSSEGHLLVPPTEPMSRATMLGSDRAIYGRGKDGFDFRVMIWLDSCIGPQGRILTGIIRNFDNEIDMRRTFVSEYPALI